MNNNIIKPKIIIYWIYVLDKVSRNRERERDKPRRAHERHHKHNKNFLKKIFDYAQRGWEISGGGSVVCVCSRYLKK